MFVIKGIMSSEIVIIRLYTEFECSPMLGIGQKVCGGDAVVWRLNLVWSLTFDLYCIKVRKTKLVLLA